MSKENVEIINIEDNNSLYSLYIHTCLSNDKVYVGITYKDAR